MAKKRMTGFGLRLKELREQAGMTQAALSQKAGMHVMGLAKIEHGDREPAWASVLALAEALGVSVEAFVVEAEAAPSKPARPSPASQDSQPASKPAKKGGKGQGRKKKGT